MGWIDIEEECFVTLFADERYSQIFDGRGEVMGYGLESGTKLIHGERVSFCFTRMKECSAIIRFECFFEGLVNNFLC